MVVFNRFTADYSRPYHCCYVGRRSAHAYRHSTEEILSTFGHLVIYHDRIDAIFSPAMGDYGYLTRSPDLEEIHTVVQFVLEKP